MCKLVIGTFMFIIDYNQKVYYGILYCISYIIDVSRYSIVKISKRSAIFIELLTPKSIDREYYKTIYFVSVLKDVI